MVLSEVQKRNGRDRVVAEELARRLRDEHLAAVPGSGDPRRTVHTETYVAFSADRGLAGVNPHADAELGAVRPRVLREPALAGDRGGHRILGTAEADEERIPLRVDLVAAVLDERLAQDPLVILERFPVAITEPLEQLCRALDVGEQEGDSSDRQFVD